MTIEKIINSSIDMFYYLKYSTLNYCLFIECYQLDNYENSFKYEMNPNTNYPVILSAVCKFQNMIRDGYWLISHLIITKITYKSEMYANLVIGSTIKIRKCIYDMLLHFGYSSLFDTYYQLIKSNIFLLDATQRECYLKSTVLKVA
jgi:hypothetical protein